MKVDKVATVNNLTMQFQADMIRVPVVKPLAMETPTLGAAYAAGLAMRGKTWRKSKSCGLLQKHFNQICQYRKVLRNGRIDQGFKNSLDLVDDETEYLVTQKDELHRKDVEFREIG